MGSANGTINGVPVVVEESEITGLAGYINTEFDFWSEDNQEGIWSVSENGMPELKKFTDETPIKKYTANKVNCGVST